MTVLESITINDLMTIIYFAIVCCILVLAAISCEKKERVAYLVMLFITSVTFAFVMADIIF